MRLRVRHIFSELEQLTHNGIILFNEDAYRFDHKLDVIHWDWTMDKQRYIDSVST